MMKKQLELSTGKTEGLGTTLLLLKAKAGCVLGRNSRQDNCPDKIIISTSTTKEKTGTNSVAAY